LVMMLTTCAWTPPIWLAMLPQKFSAATTLTTRPPGGEERVVSAVADGKPSTATATHPAVADHRGAAEQARPSVTRRHGSVLGFVDGGGGRAGCGPRILESS